MTARKVAWNSRATMGRKVWLKEKVPRPTARNIVEGGHRETGGPGPKYKTYNRGFSDRVIEEPDKTQSWGGMEKQLPMEFLNMLPSRGLYDALNSFESHMPRL